ncbi:MAG: FmdB family zinc ribbon protein [Deltaproteobacteria bacterium]
MPTYEYECRACGHRFEMMQSMTAAPIKTCPKCSKKKVVRLIGAGGGLIFKGAGFYATDYRKGPAPTTSACPAAGDKPGCAGCPKNPS